MSTVIHCGMPSEQRILQAAYPNALVLSGQDKLRLPELVPPDCTRLIGMGLAGGVSKLLKVPDCVTATVVVDKADSRATPDAEFNARASILLAHAGITLKPARYYSDGLLNEANEMPQRAALAAKYNVDAIDDEARFMVAEAQRRNIPFNIFRAVSDAWDDNLPLLAIGNVLNSDGSANLPYLLTALGQDQDVDGNPSESIFTVAFHAGQSLHALEAMARALAPIITE